MKKITFIVLLLDCFSTALAGQTIRVNRVTATSKTNYLSEEILNHNGTAHIISSDTLKRGAVRNIDESLQKIPGIQIRDYSGAGILPKISVRGFGGQGNGHSNTGLIMLDGVNIYSAPYSNIELALFPITTQMVDYIEVTKGAAALWAGPNTFGGVINIHSKPIPKEWETEISEKITWWGLPDNIYKLKENGKPFGNNMLFDTYIRTGGYITQNFGIQGQANVIKGESFRENTPQTIQNYKLDTIYDISEHHSLKSYIQYYEFNSKLAGSLTPADYIANRFQNKRPYLAASGATTRFGLNYDYDFEKENIDGDVNIAYYYHNLSRDFTLDNKYREVNYTGNNAPTTITDHLRSFVVNGFAPKLTLNIDGQAVKQKIVTGATYTSEQITPFVYTTTISTGATEQTSRNFHNNHFLAFHISDEITLFDKLILTPGLRYDFLYYNGEYTQSGGTTNKQSIYHEVSGGFNIGYKPVESVLVFANYNRSFLPKQYGANPLLNVNYNQHANVAEAGVRYNFNNDIVMTATYFYIYVDNQSVTQVSGGQIQAGATSSQGAEFEFYYNPSWLEGLNIHLGYNFIDARQLKSGPNYMKFLPFVSPHQLIADVSYNFGKTVLSYSSYFYSSAFSDLDNNVKENWTCPSSSGTSSQCTGGKIPAYYAANIQVSRPLWESGKQALIGSLQVNNIFNDKYWFIGDGTSPKGRYPAPGRSVSVQFRYLF